MKTQPDRSLWRFITVIAGVLLLAASTARGQAVAGYSEYFIPGDEDTIGAVLCSLGTTACPAGYLTHAAISMAGWTNATSIYYDHWEDGYDFDPENPATADEITTVNAGGFRVFETANIALPTTTQPTCSPAGTCNYDGRDHIYVAGGAVTVSRISWIEERGVGLQGMAWEIYPVKPQLTHYIVPFGETSGWDGFQRISTLIQATRDATTITIDINGDGTPDVLDQNRDGDITDPGDTAIVTLNRGESFRLDNVSANRALYSMPSGIVIQGTETLQVKYITGRDDRNNCTRGFSAFPRGYWTRDYYAPLDQPTAPGEESDTDYYLYNPHATALTINWQSRTTSGSFSIPANSTVSYRTASGVAVPQDQGLYFSGNDVFWGVGSYDANRYAGTTGYAHEWGYSLLPSTMLFQEHYLGWTPDGYWPADVPPGPRAGDDEMGIYIIPAQDNTRIFVDFDNNGAADLTYTLDRLESQYVIDPDGNLSGARVWGTGLFSIAYGQNGDTSPNSTPAMDLGYIAIPANDFISLVLAVDKTANPVVVSPTAGSTSVFTLAVNSQKYTLDNVYVLDNMDAGWSYVNNTTTITLPNLSQVTGAAANPAITAAGALLPSPPFNGTDRCPTGRGPCLSWSNYATATRLGNMAENQQILIQFTAQHSGLTAGTLRENRVSATGTRTIGSPAVTQTFTATDFAFNIAGALAIAKSTSAANPVFPGDTFTYTTIVTNPAGSGVTQTGVSLNDPMPTGVTYVPGTAIIRNATVADTFTTASYANQDGTLRWENPVGTAVSWAETDSGGGGATGGYIQVTGGQLRIANTDDGTKAISRGINLTGSGATGNATLTYNYTTSGNLENADVIYCQYRLGGGGWNTLATYTNDVTGNASHTIPLANPANLTEIRFAITSNLAYGNSAEYFYVDNVVLTFDRSAGAPPELISSTLGAQLLPGASLQVELNVTANDPFPSGLTTIVNTSSVTSTQMPIPIYASATNTVLNPSVQSASVGDRVWLDADRDGVQDIGEPGIVNIELTLKDRFGTPIATTVTDSTGHYLFTGVTPGTGYYVEATDFIPSGLSQVFPYITTPGDLNNNRTTSFDLVDGQVLLTADLGYAASTGTAAFGDLVWVDANANGVRDPGEIALAGVTINLYRDVNGNRELDVVAGPGTVAATNGSTTITGTGTSFLNYHANEPIVINGVLYTIASVASDTSLTLTAAYTGTTGSGLTYTAPPAGTGTVEVSNGSTLVTGTGTTFSNYSTGQAITIAGVPYTIASVTSDTSLTLTTNYTGTTGSGRSYYGPGDYLVTTTVSDPDPSYLFTGVAASGVEDYLVHVDPAQPALTGYTPTIATPYSFLDVTAGSSYLTADFGYRSTGTMYRIDDRVWLDADGDAVFDAGESGIGGVTVQLLNDTLQVIATTTTAADGTFSFSGLPGGGADYTVRLNDASGVLLDYYGTTVYGINKERAESNLTADIDRVDTPPTVPPSGQPSYGYRPLRSIGDTVWYDNNADRVVDTGENGIAGVVVTLYRDVDGDAVIDLAAGAGTIAVTNGSSTVTGTGTSFRNFHAGEPILIAGVLYTIQSVASNTSMTLTTTYAGATTSGLAYSAPPQGAGTVAVTLGSPTVTGTGTTFTNYRAGEPITIAGVPYVIASIASNTSLTLTTNYTGTTGAGRAYYGPGDANLGNVTTDANGQYLFSGLANRTYIVSVPAQTGYTYTGAGTTADSDATAPGLQQGSTIASGVSDFLRDFGFDASTPYNLGGTIWDDTDKDGVIEGGEPRLANVTVEVLLDIDGDGVIDAGDTLVATVATNSSGYYQVAGLASGTYIVRITDTASVLNGYEPTYEKTGGISGPFNSLEAVNLTSGNVTDVNFGYKKPTPTYAAVESLIAFVANGGVTVQWRTSLEVGTIGFDLLRYNPATAEFEKLNGTVLPGLIVHPEGGTYEFVDEDAPQTGSVTYLLVEVDLRGRRREHGPYSVIVGLQSPPEHADTKPQEAPWSVGGYGRWPREVPQAQQERYVTLAVEREAAALAAAAGRGGTLKISTNAAGLHFVSATQIASQLGIKIGQTVALINRGDLRLTNAGVEVAYLPAADGQGLYFYAQTPATIYTTENAYWLSVAHGRVMRQAPPAPTGASVVSFTDTLHREVNQWALPVVFQDPESDFWCWDYLYAGVSGQSRKSFTASVPGVTDGAATLKVRLQGGTETTSPNDHHAVIYWNGANVGDAQWDGTTATEIGVSLGAGAILEGNNTLEVEALLGSGVPYSVIYLDAFEVTYSRQLQAVANELELTVPGSAHVTIGGFTSPSILVLDLGSSEEPTSLVVGVITPTGGGLYQVAFSSPSGAPRRFLAIVPAQAKAPVRITAPRSAGLVSSSNRADYVIIAPNSLLAAATALAQHHASRGLETMVVPLEAVYNEFSFGVVSPHAIRTFLQHAVAEWHAAPRYALLLGRGTYDYKNYRGFGDNVLPPLMAATPYGLYVSDTKIADLSGDDGIPEIALGRLPVLTAQEVFDYLAKISTHELATNPMRVLMTADNPDAAGSFNEDSDAVAAIVPPSHQVTKVYLPTYTGPAGRQAILDAINTSGVSVFNYIGHGGFNRLADENLLVSADVAALTNTTTLPIFLGMTCAAGNFGLPGFPSLAELMLVKPSGGIYASWSSSGLAENDGSVVLSKAFFQTTFVEGEHALGDITASSFQSPPVAALPAFMRHLYNLLGEPVSRVP
jgi:uncharacterized repeat protein (TIGR01451 family)